ncbi:MAG: insulinase family protein [Chloroflexi bacterium]|nr:insulinase family protein [Chloroflexota bacterium]MCL5110537.1 insulinase family protein [Chloroflexota bacterium]
MYKKTALPNGLRVLTSDMPHARSVSLAFFVSAGSRHEDPRRAGVAHFLEHMFFKGTQNRPNSQEISEAIEGVGGIINAEVGKEMAVYWAKVAQQHTTVALDILTDVLRHSLFDRDEIEKERRVILEELNMIADDPREWVDVILDEVMWGDQALGRDVGGTKETVSAMRREDILGYLAARYSPRSTVISVAGALEHERIVDDLASRLGDWQGPPLTPPPAAVIDQTAPRLRVQEKDTEQAHVSLGLRAISYLDPERYALDLLNVILGEGMSSRLFLEIREKRGLAYDVHSYVNHYQDTGAMVAYAGVEPGKVYQTVAALMEQISRMKEPTPSQELAKAKEFWKGRMILRLEDTRGIASWVGSQEILLDQVLSVDEVIDIIDRLSAEDVQRAAHRLFTDDRLSLAVVGPVADGNHLSSLLHFQ